jgi:hypothetical protein
MCAAKSVDRSWDFNYSTAKEANIKPLCQRVEEHFQLPPRRLCRYFANSDDDFLLTTHGSHFRGFHAPISAKNELPIYLLHCFFHPFEDLRGDVSDDEMIAFDNLIYIRDSTCADATGVVETYAHELQHFVQHGTLPRLSFVNSVLYHNLKRLVPTAIATDVPSEREANIVSKRVAEIVCGVEAVTAFADEQVRLMDAAGEQEQKARWIFFRNVPSSTKYDWQKETLAMVEEYKARLDFKMDTDKPEWWVGPIVKDDDVR